ncbi:MAG TPA: hypothetical protein VFN61_14250, partial [Acidimicrobiales bacterium]|nr:hypothetical protein [Acidimicrobiales bacterium]
MAEQELAQDDISTPPRGVAEVTGSAPTGRTPGPHIVRGRPGRREMAVVALFSIATAVAFFHSAWSHPATVQVGPGGDADEYSWFLAWMPFALGHGLNPLVSTYLNFPHGINLMWNTSVVLPSFLVSPVTVLFGPSTAYNVLMTLALALTATFCYLAFRRWTGPVPALVGALLAGFSPYMFSQANGHLAQTLLLSAPLLVIVLDRLLAVQSSRCWVDGLWLGVLAWAQLLTGEEILFMEAVTASVALVVLAAWHHAKLTKIWPYAWRGSVVAGATFGVLSAPFLAVQFLGPYRVKNPHPPNVYVSDLLNFISPTQVTEIYPSAAAHLAQHYTGNISEQGAYLGIPFLVLMVATVIMGWRRPLVWAVALAALATGVLSMGPTLHHGGVITKDNLPFFDLSVHVPLFSNLLADRFASTMTIAAGFLVALGCEQFWRSKLPVRVTGMAVAVLGLVAIFPTTSFLAAPSPSYSAFTSGLACPPRSAALPSGKPGVALVVPAINEMDLLWQAESQFCLTMPSDTGMTGTNSGVVGDQGILRTLGQPGQAMLPTTPKARQQAAAQIAALHISEIIVGPEWPAVPGWTPQGQAEAVAWLQWLIGRAPQQS